MPRGKKLSSEVVARIYELNCLGKSWVKIATELGIGRTAVGVYLRHKSPEALSLFRAKRQMHRKYNRLTTTINGVHKAYKVRKRPKPECCELCREEISKLLWHHWDDEHLEWGMWLCWRCHRFAEGVERGLHEEAYINLKEKLLVPLEVDIKVSQYWG